MTQPILGYGTCLATLPNAQGQLDLTPEMSLATGTDVLAQSLIRRQTTPRGGDVASPNDCLDLRGYLSKGVTQGQLGALSQAIRNELLKDQRVQSVSVGIALDTSTGIMTVTESIGAATGPFTLTLQLTAGSVAFIVQGQ